MCAFHLVAEYMTCTVSFSNAYFLNKAVFYTKIHNCLNFNRCKRKEEKVKVMGEASQV